MTSLHAFMRHPLSHTQSLGITSMCCLTERGRTVHHCFNPWLTPPELADHIPCSTTELGGSVARKVHQQTPSSTSTLHGSCLYRDGKAWYCRQLSLGVSLAMH